MASAAETGSSRARSDAELARAAARSFAAFAPRGEPLTPRVCDTGREETLELPAAAVRLLVEIVETMAAGRTVTVLARETELTT